MVRVAEIFSSIQGEGTRAGTPCTFVRLAGCDLACSYCDTAWARTGGAETSLVQVLDRVRQLPFSVVEVTGGEPLLQPGSIDLLRALRGEGYTVLLETSGSRPLSRVPSGVAVVMDIKTPGSGMEGHNLYANLECLGDGDEVKLVLTSRHDYEWARDLVREGGWVDHLAVIFQPAWDLVPPADLAAWILEDGLPVRLGLQFHKILWPDRDRA